MKKSMTFAMITVMVLMGSCSQNDEPDKWENAEPSPYKQIELPPSTRAAADANAGFTFKLFNEISSEDPQNNVVCSPFSMFTALSMLANGDNGESRDEILRLLGYPEGEEGIAVLNQYCRTLLIELPNADRSTNCHFANSIWMADNGIIDFNPEFKSKCNDIFSATAHMFSEGSGPQLINRWIEKETNGKIKDLVPSDAEFDMSVVNAVYFKGKWVTPFDLSKTAAGTFHNIDGSLSEGMFMHGGSHSYYETDDLQGTSLYFGNGNFSLMLIRTKTGQPVSLDREKWDDLMQGHRGADVTMSVPRFTVDFKTDLLESLKKLGLDRVTDAKIGLKDVAKEVPMHVASVNHGANFAIDEYGVEAAAATAIGMSSGPGYDLSVNIDFNVPFMYIIRETSTNTILFIGNMSKLP